MAPVPRTEASSASGRTYGGAGTALPKPIGCQLSKWRPHQSRAPSGTGDSAPPLTAPNASRAPMTNAIAAMASATATGSVRNRATSPVSAKSSSSSVLCRATGGDGSRSAAAARRRSATSAAWLVAAAARSLTKSSPCR